MKILIYTGLVGALLVGVGVVVYATHSSQNGHFPPAGHFPPGANPSDAGSATVSIRQNDFDLCGDAFYVGLYDLSKDVFGAGIQNVDTSDYRERVFHYIRTTDTFTMGDREAWVDHVKDIPGQLVDIIGEDPKVLDNCSNFSVALVGPP